MRCNRRTVPALRSSDELTTEVLLWVCVDATGHLTLTCRATRGGLDRSAGDSAHTAGSSRCLAVQPSRSPPSLDFAPCIGQNPGNAVSCGTVPHDFGSGPDVPPSGHCFFLRHGRPPTAHVRPRGNGNTPCEGPAKSTAPDSPGAAGARFRASNIQKAGCRLLRVPAAAGVGLEVSMDWR